VMAIGSLSPSVCPTHNILPVQLESSSPTSNSLREVFENNQTSIFYVSGCLMGPTQIVRLGRMIA